MSFRVVAPASSANLGPGFDAAAVALELWNEVVVEPSTDGLHIEVEGEGADEAPRDATHLAVRAFEQFARAERYRFRFLNRIPFERGLGSSAAAIALGLVAGALASGRDLRAAELLDIGARLEGHADNLAAAIYGGACVAWERGGHAHAARLADDMPLVPVIAVPSSRTATSESRDGLPVTVKHEDAAVTAGSATLLGAAIASGSAELLRDAFNDRIHEQYRSTTSPLLGLLRAAPPDGVLGVTLSGSGPSVVAWTEEAHVAAVVEQLQHDLPPDTQVLALRVAKEGARLT